MARLIVKVFAALLLTWTVLVAWDSWISNHRLADAAQNESHLYQSFHPDEVIKMFNIQVRSTWSFQDSSSSPRVNSIHHDRHFNHRFTMQASRKPELLNALRVDVLSRLSMPGVTVTAFKKQADDGFTCNYTFDNGAGSISVQAPTRQTTLRRDPLSSDLDDVEVTTELEETWKRPASQTSWSMAAVD